MGVYVSLGRPIVTREGVPFRPAQERVYVLVTAPVKKSVCAIWASPMKILWFERRLWRENPVDSHVEYVRLTISASRYFLFGQTLNNFPASLPFLTTTGAPSIQN